MLMLYNSDSFAVLQFDLPAAQDERAVAGEERRGGYEIVDKFARKEIFLEGTLAQCFREGVDRLVETEPTEEALDEFIAGYTQLAQQPVTLH
ncbi:BTH_I0359 family protein [Azohydromonas caseinilytica]|uniref:DUF3567 domain-containing protein n=1 Tax=Azohydromonas caseinilytica TaxID=2728836 RepID=A0A848F626_9BURK|nr:DUF3567 domain-containing protein [Azohydromonas caseinilytica]NML13813.1 DUF3567 domain-containing protein [Azohydromonas caseinilytica]